MAAYDQASALMTRASRAWCREPAHTVQALFSAGRRTINPGRRLRWSARFIARWTLMRDPSRSAICLQHLIRLATQCARETRHERLGRLLAKLSGLQSPDAHFCPFQ